MSGFWKVVSNAGKTKTGQKIISALKGGSKKKSVFVKDKSGTITGVKPGSKIGKRKTWEEYIDTSHPSYRENWPPGK